MTRFQLRARYVLITYAQCGDLDPHAVVCLLAGLGAECIIGREDHDNGGTHLHAFTDFGKQFSTSNPRFADVDGQHPNVQPFGRTPEKGFDYAIKDGDVVGGGLERPTGSEVSHAGDIWSQIVMATSRDEFWSLVRTLAPRNLVTNFTSLRAYADWHYRPERSPYSSPAHIEFDLSDVEGLNEWVHQAFTGDTVGESQWCGRCARLQIQNFG